MFNSMNSLKQRYQAASMQQVNTELSRRYNVTNNFFNYQKIQIQETLSIYGQILNKNLIKIKYITKR